MTKEELEASLKFLGWTHGGLARMLGVSRNATSTWSTGKFGKIPDEVADWIIRRCDDLKNDPPPVRKKILKLSKLRADNRAKKPIDRVKCDKSYRGSKANCVGLYLISSQDLIKVGISGRPSKRIQGIRANSPMDIKQEDIWYIDPEYVMYAEYDAHLAFNDSHSHFYWFKYEASKAKHIIASIVATYPCAKLPLLK